MLCPSAQRTSHYEARCSDLNCGLPAKAPAHKDHITSQLQSMHFSATLPPKMKGLTWCQELHIKHLHLNGVELWWVSSRRSRPDATTNAKYLWNHGGAVRPGGSAAEEGGEDTSQEQAGSEELQRLVVIGAVCCCF